MARVKSPEKREALLQSAVREIAESGLGVSTAKIAKGAGLAEGTMFRYFPSKNDLLNALYLELKIEVLRAIGADFPHKADLRERARHIWTEYLRWAMDRQAERKVSALLNLSSVITEATRAKLSDERGPIDQTMEELGSRGAFKFLPAGFAAHSMTAMQAAVMEMASRKPAQTKELIEQAFEAFWRMAK
ncbi:TetR/AcrR family transcriptional regulator [Occallatibacter riparius]|uniref:TetR/AcrR family transcriptional regulator n=1 Tax=Occallatibacter riparius TaxID=1002689 RepID=A0A9J7BLR8_9BACT|nr:TetR/AcrR family transcriptional regulator [Occallatibacter riparius]UWZ83603.1 TetR/AcrR family transcriptional regulator [Occallatibacter riparius]